MHPVRKQRLTLEQSLLISILPHYGRPLEQLPQRSSFVAALKSTTMVLW